MRRSRAPLALVVPLVALTTLGGCSSPAASIRVLAPRGMTRDVRPMPSRMAPLPASVRIRVTDKGGTRLLRVPLEDYVLGAALAEVVLDGEEDATAERMLAVQSMAARTYAVANLGRHAREGFDLCASTHCQLYRPVQTWMRWAQVGRRAIEATRGLVLVTASLNPRPIRALFHANCGGHTSAADDVWPGEAVTYLRAERDTFCVQASRSPWQWSVEVDAMKAAVERRERTHLSRAERLEIVDRDAAGRATLVRLGKPAHALTGTDLRSIVLQAFGARSMRSTRFSVKRERDVFVFEGTGHGHGVGLCQAGALARAQAGQPPEAILAHYFPGTRLERRYADAMAPALERLADGRQMLGFLVAPLP